MVQFNSFHVKLLMGSLTEVLLCTPDRAILGDGSEILSQAALGTLLLLWMLFTTS